LRWFTANIGVHHIHHLCSRIPCYRLPDVLRDHPQLAAVGRITMLQSLRSVRLALWDEDGRRLISFGEAAVGVRRSYCARQRIVAGSESKPLAHSNSASEVGKQAGAGW
jgi:acyl-lipid omega-6 desaturase (Delta-12 desaturase)